MVLAIGTSILFLCMLLLLCVCVTVVQNNIVLPFPVISWAALGMVRYGGSHAAHRGSQGAPRKKRVVKVVAKEVQVHITGRMKHLYTIVQSSLPLLSDIVVVAVCLGRKQRHVPVNSIAYQVLNICIFPRLNYSSLQFRLRLW